MKRILAAIGNVLGIALGIVSIPVFLFFSFLATALPIILVLWILGIWPVDEDTNELTTSPAPWSETDCETLWADQDRFGLRCLKDIGTEEYEAKRREWEGILVEYKLSADEAMAGLFTWVSEQSEDCRIWVNILERPADICPY